MHKLKWLFFILLIFISCSSKITRNIYKEPVNILKLKRDAFRDFADLNFKDGTVSRALFTKVTKDSITIVNLADKAIDPVVKTISTNDIKSIIVFDKESSDYIVYTFDKPEK